MQIKFHFKNFFHWFQFKNKIGNFGNANSFRSFADHMNTESIKNKIISESIDLFMKYGLRSVTMDDIAKHLGMSKKTIYQLFKDKEDIIVQSTSVVFDAENKMMEQIENEVEAEMAERKILFHAHPNESIADGIVAFMDAAETELLAMVTQRRNLIQKLFDRSLTKRIAMTATVPMISFQAPKE